MAQSKQDLMDQVLDIAGKLGTVVPYVGSAIAAVQLISGLISRLQSEGRDTTDEAEDRQLAEVETRRASAEAEFQNLLQG